MQEQGFSTVLSQQIYSPKHSGLHGGAVQTTPLVDPMLSSQCDLPQAPDQLQRTDQERRDASQVVFVEPFKSSFHTEFRYCDPKYLYTFLQRIRKSPDVTPIHSLKT